MKPALKSEKYDKPPQASLNVHKPGFLQPQGFFLTPQPAGSVIRSMPYMLTSSMLSSSLLRTRSPSGEKLEEFGDVEGAMAVSTRRAVWWTGISDPEEYEQIGHVDKTTAIQISGTCRPTCQFKDVRRAGADSVVVDRAIGVDSLLWSK